MMRKDLINELVWWAGIILLALILLPALWTRVFGEEPVAYIPTIDAEVVDGDTIRTGLELGFGVYVERFPIRAANYDAWESSRIRRSGAFGSFTEEQWKAELAKGNAAESFLKELLKTGRLYVVLEKKRDVYGRLIGRFYVYDKKSDKLIDVADEMKINGHTRR